MWAVGREGGGGALARDNPLPDRSVAGSQLTNDHHSHLINNSKVPPWSPPWSPLVPHHSDQSNAGRRQEKEGQAEDLKHNKFIGRCGHTTFLLVDRGGEKVRIIIESIICDRPEPSNH